MIKQCFGGALTVSIDVHGAGVSLPVAIRVRLVRVAVVGAVVAAVAHVIAVVVVLPGVVHKRTVVLFHKRETWENTCVRMKKVVG